MVLFDAPSNSDVALSDLTYTNGGNDHARQGKSSAFPAIWRPKQENTTAVVSDDDILSVVNTSNTGVLPPPQEKKSDALAPRPETRRLGYFSVAALIINRMIGTGIFSTPGSVLKGTGGSKGAALFLWVLGSIATIAGLLIFLEFGILLPFNGGEFIYLQESFTRPKYLAGCIFACLFLTVGNSAPNALVFAKNMITAFDPGKTQDPRLVKFIALVCITFICLMHLFSRKVGIYTNNLFALYKVIFLLFICITGLCVLGGVRVGGNKAGEPYGRENFNGSFRQQTNTTPYSYAKSLLSVLFSLGGWETSNYVLSEVKMPKGNPNTTFKKGVFWAFGLVSVLYLFANIAYFAASTVEEIQTAGTNVAYNFFAKVFGQGKFPKRGLPVFLAASAFGNLVSTVYTHSRVEQEVARQKLLPWSSYWARNSNFGTPVGALTFHWFFAAVLILATPKITSPDGSAYDLLTNMRSYGQAWIAAAVAIGLATLHLHRAEWRPAVLGTKRLVNALAGFYILFNIFIVIMIWYPPDRQGVINSYITPGVSTGLIVFGIIYWFGFAKLTPLLGWRIDEVPIELADGTQWISFERYSETGFAAWIEGRLKKRHPTSTST